MMPELTAILVGMLMLSLIVGIVLGWIVQGIRCARARVAINEGWRVRLQTLQSEHSRLIEQNKNLMAQINQFQVTQKESTERINELTASLNESFYLRDELRQQITEHRRRLQAMTAKRDEMKTAYDESASRSSSATGIIKEKDGSISRLKRELRSWQMRLTPLVQKFTARNQEAANLESELEAARSRIEKLEEADLSSQTGVEPVNAESSPDELGACHEAHGDSPAEPASGLQDQTPPPEDSPARFEPEATFDEGTSGIEDEIPLLDDATVFPDAKSGNGEDGSESVGSVIVSGRSEIDDINDDLKQIKGIGPAIEKTLNDLGIRCFIQLAEMNEHEIDRVAQQLKGFRSRIYREDWLGQARDLEYQKAKNIS